MISLYSRAESCIAWSGWYFVFPWGSAGRVWSGIYYKWRREREREVEMCAG